MINNLWHFEGDYKQLEPIIMMMRSPYLPPVLSLLALMDDLAVSILMGQ
jgi:hypothetical protein